jgi:hypothetical protein
MEAEREQKRKEKKLKRQEEEVEKEQKRKDKNVSATIQQLDLVILCRRTPPLNYKVDCNGRMGQRGKSALLSQGATGCLNPGFVASV